MNKKNCALLYMYMYWICIKGRYEKKTLTVDNVNCESHPAIVNSMIEFTRLLQYLDLYTDYTVVRSGYIHYTAVRSGSIHKTAKIKIY